MGRYDLSALRVRQILINLSRFINSSCLFGDKSKTLRLDEKKNMAARNTNALLTT